MRFALASSVIVVTCLMIGPAQADAPSTPSQLLEQANTHFNANEYQQAAEIYRSIIASKPDTPLLAKAIYNLGMTQQAMGQHREAIATYQQIFNLTVDDREPGGHIMETYRNYRPNAMWQIGQCHYALGEYRQALDAIEKNKSLYPFQSWCGNGMAEARHRYAFHTALCYEQLGDYTQAVTHYYRAIHEGGMLHSDPNTPWRLVELYHATGQKDDLRRMMELRKDFDHRHFEASIVQLSPKEQAKRRKHNTYFSMQPVQEMMNLYQLRDDKQWAPLTTILLLRDDPCYEAGSRRTGWSQALAAHLLASDPDTTWPLLYGLIDERKNRLNRWLYYALGLNGTKDAIAILEPLLKAEQNYHWRTSLLYSLALAGHQPSINELKTIDRTLFGVAFPPLPGREVQLPVDLAVLDEEIAYTAALSQKVHVDLSTPEKAVETFMLGGLTADKAVFQQATTRTDWDDFYNVLTESAKDKLRYRFWPAQKVSNGSMQVVLQARTPTGRQYVLQFQLRQQKNQWKVVDIQEIKEIPIALHRTKPNPWRP